MRLSALTCAPACDSGPASRKKIRDHAVRGGHGSNLARVPGWSAVLGAEYKTLAVIGALLRRSLFEDRLKDIVRGSVASHEQVDQFPEHTFLALGP